MKSKRIKWIVMTFLLVIGRIYDVYSTSLYTPDLKKESNLVVKLLGAGWMESIVLQLVILTVVIGLLYHYIFKFRTVKPSQLGVSFKEYISYFFFNDVNSFARVFYKIPENRSAFFAMTGYVTSLTLIATSFVVGTSTTMLLLNDSYKELYSRGIPYLLYGIIAVLAGYFTHRFFKIEYIKYLREIKHHTDAT